MRSVVLVLGSAVLILACSSARPPIEASTGTLTSAEVARDDGWSRYQHAVELQRQGRVDVALVTYREAAQLFEKSGDRHGHARLRALRRAGRQAREHARARLPQRYDESILAYSRAEARFAHDRKLRALARYGRARAYTALARCEKAKRAYAEYADVVRSDSPGSAELAEEVSRHCVNK
jgi:tetratricopeptide (TPR) repeat protein